MTQSPRRGYQFLGTIAEVKEGAMLDGFNPELEKKEKDIPQIESRLKIEINEVLNFATGPHSDKNVL